MIPTKTTEIGIQRIKMNPQYWVHTSVIIGESTVLGTCFSNYWRIHSIGYMLQSLLANPQYWVHASVIIGESTVLGTCFSHYWSDGFSSGKHFHMTTSWPRCLFYGYPICLWFYHFSIGVWNCLGSVVFLFFNFITTLLMISLFVHTPLAFYFYRSLLLRIFNQTSTSWIFLCICLCFSWRVIGLCCWMEYDTRKHNSCCICCQSMESVFWWPS